MTKKAPHGRSVHENASMAKPLAHYRVLLIEDNEDDAALVRHALTARPGFVWDLDWVDRLEVGAAALAEHPYQVVLLDLSLPDSRGLDGLTSLAHKFQDTPIVVVTGHQSENVRAALSGRQVVFVDNPQFADGLSSSLRVGLAQLDSSIDGALICLGDMPKVRREHIESLLGAFEPSDGREIIVPTFAGRRGNPVLWAARYFPMMKELSGDLGARELQKRFVDRVCLVPMPDDAVTIDVDTKEALDSLRSVGA